MNKYIKRELEKKILSLSEGFSAVALTGPRQSGKSTLLKHLFKDTHNYVTFDDPSIRERAISDPKLFLEELGKKVIIDEIQYIPEILSYIKMSIDNERNLAGKFILTGSQQFSLTKNLGDSLAGRIGILELLPFSINEIKSSPLGRNLNSTLGLFINACLKGSFPEVVLKDKNHSKEWYASYINTYLERDIRSIYDIGNLREFNRFLQLLASRTSQILNFSTYSNELGVSVNTIKKWISILEASRIIYLLPPYYETFGKRISKSPKIHFLDVGLVCYLVGITEKSHLINGPMAGQLFETFCIQETVKAYFNKGLKPNLFYVRTQNDLEVDLIIKIAQNIFPVEIKFSKTIKPSMSSGLSRFKKVFSKLNIQKGKILSLSEEEIKLTSNVKTESITSFIEWISNN